MRIVPIGVLLASVVVGACDLLPDQDDESDGEMQHCYLVKHGDRGVTIDSVLPDTTNVCVMEVDIESTGDSVLPDTMFKAFRTAPRDSLGM